MAGERHDREGLAGRVSLDGRPRMSRRTTEGRAPAGFVSRRWLASALRNCHRSRAGAHMIMPVIAGVSSRTPWRVQLRAAVTNPGDLVRGFIGLTGPAAAPVDRPRCAAASRYRWDRSTRE
jgi:hypothetical protein